MLRDEQWHHDHHVYRQARAQSHARIQRRAFNVKLTPEYLNLQAALRQRGLSTEADIHRMSKEQWMREMGRRVGIDRYIQGKITALCGGAEHHSPATLAPPLPDPAAEFQLPHR